MDNTGVDFPAGPDGRRGTSAPGRAVVAAALRPVDPAAAAAVERESRWRTAYLAHFRRMVEAGLDSPADWLAIARAGLAEVDRQLCVVRPDGTEAPLPAVLTDPAERELKTDEVRGAAAPTEFVLPYGRELLRGEDIRRRVDAWTRPASRSRRWPGRSRRCCGTRSGCGWTAGRSPPSARAPRWGRCRRCCAGGPPWPRSTSPPPR